MDTEASPSRLKLSNIISDINSILEVDLQNDSLNFVKPYLE